VIAGGRRSTASWLGSVAVAAGLLSPVVFLLVEAAGAGTQHVISLVNRALTAQLLWNTVRLTVVVTVLCAVIGTGAAWLVERTNLPARRLWAVVLVVPLAIPDFVVSFGWASLNRSIHGFGGSVLVMTLAVYPLVYVPVSASLRNADPSLEEVSRSLGAGPLRTFVRVTLGQSAVAILGGCLLVALAILAEYGAFEIMAFQTFTTEIFTEYSASFDVAAACGLSLVLVVLGAFVLFGESTVRGRRRVSRVDRFAQRSSRRIPLGRWSVPSLAAVTAVVAGALGVPVYTALRWWIQGTRYPLQGASLPSATLHTAAYGAMAAAVCTLAAVPVAVLAVRHDGFWSRVLERSTYIVLAVPGIVIALSLSYFSERYAGGFDYQQTPMLVAAYAILFFPMALVGVKASVAQCPPDLEEVARSLGSGRIKIWWKVTGPLLGPGLVAAFCLVFISVVTELTATLLLVPTGVQTLATQFWAYQTNGNPGQAAPYALVMIAIAAVPSYVLGRFFDRMPTRAV
jgi:iron(III) transport system permease protein